MDWRIQNYPLTPVSLLAIQGPRGVYAQATSKGLPDQSSIRLPLYTNSYLNCQENCLAFSDRLSSSLTNLFRVDKKKISQMTNTATPSQPKMNVILTRDHANAS